MDFAAMELRMTALSLYHATQQGDWKEALETYKKNPSIHETVINSSGDTVLHVAVNDDQELTVAELVDEIKRNQSWSALKKKNDRGDTPLHCAAARGSLNMCVWIAQAQGDNKLSEERNKKGETPLFLAALNGHKEAFLYLHFRCPDHYSRLWQRSDGQTALHCTILREHFHLAFQIILLYKGDIVGSVDEKGVTPLHIPANKPSAFEKSSNFRFYNKLVYNCIIVERLRGPEQRSNYDDTLLNRRKLSQKTQTDAENPSYSGFENVAPPNYWTCFDIFVRLFICFIQPVVEFLGLQDLEDLKKKKEKHVWCRQILEQIWTHKEVAYVGGVSAFQGYPLSRPDEESPAIQVIAAKKKEESDWRKESAFFIAAKKKEEESDWRKESAFFIAAKKKEESDWRKESAFFIAARNGVLEILEKIMKHKPGAIHETNLQGRNILHVAVESRQPHVFDLFKKHLLSEKRLWDNLVQSVDNEGNTILHLAAKLSQYKPWHIPGSALQMQWEIKWFLYIKDITPRYVLFLPNDHDETPAQLFTEDHKELVHEGTDWLHHTSESCSVVAALIAGVAFATATTIPGGTQEETGKPYLQRHPAFNVFALTSLLALCCSITSLTMFLAILTSRHQPRDFHKDLPLKLLLGLSSLFLSIASILVSFSAAFFFVLKDSLQQVVFPLYAATILPVTFYAVAQFPLYADLVRAIFRKAPQASNRESEKLIL